MKPPKKPAIYLEIIPLLIGISIPLLMMFLYLKSHHSYPRSDGGEYANDVMTGYISLKTDGIFGALNHVYFHRQWRPILHSYLSIPLMALFSGDLLKSIHVHLAISFSIFLTFVYLITRNFLPAISSILITVCLGTLNYIVFSYNSYMSELTFLSAASGTLYFLIRYSQESYTRWAYPLFACLAFAACVRPIETMLMLVPSSLLVFIDQYRDKSLSTREALVILLTGVALIFALVIPAVITDRILNPTETSWVLLAVAAILTTSFFIAKKLKVRTYTTNGFYIFYTLTTLWYAPYMHGLFYWIYLSNFSSLAKNFGGRQDVYYLGYLDNILIYLSKNTLICLAIMAAVILVFKIGCAFLFKKEKIKPLKTKNITPKIVATIILTPALIAIVSHNGDPRYYQLCGLSLTTLLFYIILDPKIPLFNLRFLFASLVVMIQLAAFHEAIFFGPEKRYPEKFYEFTERFIPPHRNTDIVVPLISALREQKIFPTPNWKESEISIALVFLNFLEPMDSPDDPSLEQWAASLRSMERGVKWHFLQANFAPLNSIAEIAKALNDGGQYDYLLIGVTQINKIYSSNFKTLRLNSTDQLIKQVSEAVKVTEPHILEIPYEPPYNSFQVVTFKLHGNEVGKN